MKITRSGRNVRRRTVAAETGPGRVPGVRDGTGGVVPRETPDRALRASAQPAYAMLATSADLGAVRDLDRLPRY